MADDAAMTPPAGPARPACWPASPPSARSRPRSIPRPGRGRASRRRAVLPMRPRRRRIGLGRRRRRRAGHRRGRRDLPALAGRPATRSRRPSSPADQVLAAADAQQVSIDFADGSKATRVPLPSEGKAVLLTEDMAAPPAGKVYELWLQDASGDMVPAGLMPGRRPAGAAQGRRRQGDRRRDHRRAARAGRRSPTTEPIALFDLDKATA